MIFLQFPSFNIHSIPLFVLAIQGLVFSILLLFRFFKKRNLTDLFLGLILLITCWHQTTYTIGFMAWYDTFRNTKINYFLISQSLALAPLLYFYVKSITEPHFQFRKKDFYHFIPALIFTCYKLFLYFYDAAQPGFADTQNGYLLINLDWKYVGPFTHILSNFQMLLYLAFTLQIFYKYRAKIRYMFSNVFRLELNWVRNFLIIYTFLFIYGLFQTIIDVAITNLSWTQEWWYFFFSSLAIIYIGIIGYFTDTSQLNRLDFEQGKVFKAPAFLPKKAASTEASPITQESKLSPELLIQKQKLESYFESKKPYLNPDLNLIDLAKSLQMTRAQLSELINLGFQQNFNDFINQHRVASVKEMLKAGRQEQLSLLGIAYECGFNSKATFNRVFKKWTGSSPTEYMRTLG